MIKCILLCLVFGAASAKLKYKITDTEKILESIVERKIYEAIEDFRTNLKENSEPYVIGYKYFDGSEIGLPDSYLSINGTKIMNLSTFEVNNLKAKMKYVLPLIYKINFDIGIPTINVTIDAYDLNATIENLFINGNGEASFLFIMPQLMGTLEGQVTFIGSQIGFVILNADVKLSLKEFKSSISGMYNDEIISKLINEILEDIVPVLVKFYEKSISEVLNALIPKLINED